MKKEKTIHIRVSDTLYERLSKSAETNGTTVSGYTRKVLKNSVTKVKNPFEEEDFLHMAQWIFTVRDESPEAFIFDVRHYLKIINKYYPFLDAKLQLIFDNVIKDLKEIIWDYKKYKNTELEFDNFYYAFGKEDDEFSFDYDEFQKYF